jgi:hypothetical protein
VSNPYVYSSGASNWTTSKYDAAGRVYELDEPDGNNKKTWSFSGLTTTATDEASNSIQTTVDLLGRVVNVLEPNAAGTPTVPTTYTYDLSGLRTVNQQGIGNESSRARSFSYDSLSRLLSATNPETGTISYLYNVAGALCAGDQSLPCSKTDARGVTTTFTYDVVNRIQSKQYSAGGAPDPTPWSCYSYDTATNGIGRLATEWTQVGMCGATAPLSDKSTRRSILTYDALGRAATEQRCVLGNCKVSTTPFSLTVGHDFNGNITSYDNGLGTLTIGNFYDAANRLYQVTSSVNDATHPQSLYYVSDFQPFGAPHSSLLGGNISITQTYDLRLRSTGLSAVKQ